MPTSSTFRFRFHWRFEPGRTIPELSGEATITLPGIGKCEIKPVLNATAVEGCSFALTSPPYTSEAEARRASEMALSGLLFSTLRSGFAVLLLPQRPPPLITDVGLQWFAAMAGDVDTLYRDRLGITVFQEIGRTRFLSASSPDLSVESTFESFVAGWEPKAVVNLSRRNLIAYELYASSRSETSGRARFLLLVMAIEALATQSDRPADEQALIARLIADVKTSTLASDRRNALINGLHTFKKNSISDACRRLIGTAIKAEAISDTGAVDHFGTCYRIRGKIVHSGKTPSPGELTNEANRLEQTVRQLLTWALEQPSDDLEGLWPSEFTSTALP